jgi:hypothetical protein
MIKIFNFITKTFVIFYNSFSYIYVNSILKKKFSENLFLKRNEKLLIGVIDNISHTPTFVNLEFLIYCKSLDYKKNYILVLPFEKKIKTLYKKKDNLVKDDENLRYRTILQPALDIIENFDPNIVFLSNRYEALNFLNGNNSNKVILPQKFNVLKVTKVDDKVSFLKKYLLAYQKTKKKVVLKAPNVFVELVKKYINFEDDQKIVTISLKDAYYSRKRNSKISEWIKFSSFLKKNKIRVIYILDISSLGNKNYFKKLLKDYEIYDLFSYDIRARLALYEISYLNCSISSGTNTLLFHSNSNYLLFSPINNKIHYGTGSYSLWLKHTGIKFNDQFPFALNTQKIVWTKNNEKYSCMVKEFKEFEKKLKT